jgi:hypothetical protein
MRLIGLTDFDLATLILHDFFVRRGRFVCWQGGVNFVVVIVVAVVVVWMS